MKWSAIAALCAAPLALAGSVAEVVERGDSKSYGGSVDIIIEEVIVIWLNPGNGASTTVVGSTSALASTAAAATHTVIVGGSAGLVYTPDSIEAAIGDMVIFTFMTKNHTATQSSFLTPCVKLEGGMDSGFMANVNNTVVPAPQFAVQVAVSTPLWFYCRQKVPESHCGAGMTFSINPTANKTQAQFQAMAIAQNGTVSSSVSSVATAVVAASSTLATVAVSAATTTDVAAAAASSVTAGTGSTGASGLCECSCFCGVTDFPAAVQGLAAFGGLSGSLPMSAM